MNIIDHVKNRIFPGNKPQIDEYEGDKYTDALVVLQIFRDLGMNVQSIPLVSRRWNQLFFGPYYDELYEEKKPFGIREWKKHLNVDLNFEPRIRMDKLIQFDPKQGYLTYIPVKLRFEHSDGTLTEELLNYDNILRCAKQGANFYKFDQGTLDRYFQFRSPYWIVDGDTPREGYWIDISTPKKVGPQEIVQLFHNPGRKNYDKNDHLPRLLPMLVTMITAHKRSGSFFDSPTGRNRTYFIVNELVKANPLLTGNPQPAYLSYKLCIAFSESGISVRPIVDLRQQLNTLKFVHAESVLRDKPFLNRVFRAVKNALDSYHNSRSFERSGTF